MWYRHLSRMRAVTENFIHIHIRLGSPRRIRYTQFWLEQRLTHRGKTDLARSAFTPEQGMISANKEGEPGISNNLITGLHLREIFWTLGTDGGNGSPPEGGTLWLLPQQASLKKTKRRQVQTHRRTHEKQILFACPFPCHQHQPGPWALSSSQVLAPHPAHSFPLTSSLSRFLFNPLPFFIFSVKFP